MMLTWQFLSFADPTLTIENLVGVMEKLTSDEEMRRKVWTEVLMFNLVIPKSYLDEVYTKYTGDGVTHTLADVYIYSGPESSWQHLLSTLYRNCEMAAAKEAKTFLQQQNGEAGINYNGLFCHPLCNLLITYVRLQTCSYMAFFLLSLFCVTVCRFFVPFFCMSLE